MKYILKIMAAASVLLPLLYTPVYVLAADNVATGAYTVDGVSARYPAGSIQSSEAANSALVAVTEARNNIEIRFAAEQRTCYPKFFATSCLNEAAEHRRLDLQSLRKIEVEANAYLRHATVVERDRNLAEKAAQRASDAASRSAAGGDAKEPLHVHVDTTDAERKANTDAYDKKIADQAEKQRQLKEKERAEAPERAANVIKYQEKVKEAEDRQKEVAEKKAEKERELQNK